MKIREPQWLNHMVKKSRAKRHQSALKALGVISPALESLRHTLYQMDQHQPLDVYVNLHHIAYDWSQSADFKAARTAFRWASVSTTPEKDAIGQMARQFKALKKSIIPENKPLQGPQRVADDTVFLDVATTYGSEVRTIAAWKKTQTDNVQTLSVIPTEMRSGKKGLTSNAFKIAQASAEDLNGLYRKQLIHCCDTLLTRAHTATPPAVVIALRQAR